jgi:hypothetical protein
LPGEPPGKRVLYWLVGRAIWTVGSVPAFQEALPVSWY